MSTHIAISFYTTLFSFALLRSSAPQRRPRGVASAMRRAHACALAAPPAAHTHRRAARADAPDAPRRVTRRVTTRSGPSSRDARHPPSASRRRRLQRGSASRRSLQQSCTRQAAPRSPPRTPHERFEEFAVQQRAVRRVGAEGRERRCRGAINGRRCGEPRGAPPRAVEPRRWAARAAARRSTSRS